MEKLIRLVVVIILIMAGIKYGKPYLEHALRGGSRAEAPPSGSSQDAACVFAADQARDAFGSTLSSLKPGGEVDFDQTSSLDNAIYEARSACRCSTSACDYASRALDLLEETSSQIVDPSQIGSAALGAARRLNQVDDLIDQAKAAAR